MLFDQGRGPVVVMIPGLHGRWEWMRPALRELARECRVISYSLRGDIGASHGDDSSLGFDGYTQQLDDVLDTAGVERATICGISCGGFVAVRYAATRPQRVQALVLASAPAPGWQPNPQQERWLRRPWLSTPAFVATSPFRLWPEVCATHPGLAARIRFFARQGLRAAASPMIPSLMARRIRHAQRLDLGADCARVHAPTLVVSGEDGLDRVVPVTNTRTYATLIPNAQYQLLTGTGHIGVLTKPERFARMIGGFVHSHGH